MSLKYFGRYRFNDSDDLGIDDFNIRSLALEAGTITSENDATYGTSLDLDASTSLLAMGTLDSISGSDSRSFSFWAKNNTTTSRNPVFSYGELGPGSAFVVYASNENGFVGFYDHTNNYEGTTSITESSWYFYTITYDGVTLKIYVNGVEDLSSTLSLSTGTIDSLRIGTDGEGNYFDGTILDLRMFETVLDSTTVEYMFSTGPNFEEKLDHDYIERSSTRGVSISGSTISRSTYGVNTSDETNSTSFHVYDVNGALQEAARIECNQNTDDSTNMSVRVRHLDDETSENILLETVSIKPSETTFTNVDSNDDRKTIVFSSDGISINSSTPGGIFFGADKDFRIAVDNDKMVIQAYSSVTTDYVTKMEINSS